MKKIFIPLLIIIISNIFLFNTFLYSKEKVDMEIAVLVDDSGSMKYNDPHNLRIYVLYYFSDLLKGKSIRLKIFRFGGKSEEVYSALLNNINKPQLFARAIDKFKSSEKYTDYTDALIKALKTLLKSNAKEKVCFLVTDGKLDPDPENNLYLGEVNLAQISEKKLSTEVINAYKKHNIKLNIIGLSHKVPVKLLKKLSSDTGGNFYIVDTRTSVKKGFKKLMSLIISDVSKDYEKVSNSQIVINKSEIEKKAEELNNILKKKPTSKKIVKKNKKYGKIVFVLGKVLIKRAKTKIKEKAKIGSKIYAGDLIKSYGTSRATISLPTGILFQIKGNSIVSVDKYLTGKNGNKSKIKMLFGWMKTKVNKLRKGDNSLTIDTPTAVVGVRGTYFETSADMDMTQVKVFEGSVSVKANDNTGNEVIVKAGYQCDIKKGEGVLKPTLIINGNNDNNDTTPPIITVLHPAGNNDVSMSEEYNLQFIVTDENLNKVFINGVEVSDISSGMVYNYTLNLLPGLNKIIIIADDKSNNVSQVSREIEYKFLPPNPPTR